MAVVVYQKVYIAIAFWLVRHAARQCSGFLPSHAAGRRHETIHQRDAAGSVNCHGQRVVFTKLAEPSHETPEPPRFPQPGAAMIVNSMVVSTSSAPKSSTRRQTACLGCNSLCSNRFEEAPRHLHERLHNPTRRSQRCNFSRLVHQLPHLVGFRLIGLKHNI